MVFPNFFSCFLLPNFLYHTVSFLEQYHQLLLCHPCWTYRSKVMVLKLVSQHWSWQLRRVMMCWLLVCSVFSLVSHFLKVCFLFSFLYLFLIPLRDISLCYGQSLKWCVFRRYTTRMLCEECNLGLCFSRQIFKIEHLKTKTRKFLIVCT